MPAAHNGGHCLPEKHPGNAEKYAVKNTEQLPESVLAGKRLFFLGSSITLGTCSLQESFVDYLVRRNAIEAVKDAVSGTTLVDSGDDSYIGRLKKAGCSVRPDYFVCQLSTNDAWQKVPLGRMSTTGEYDVHEVTGAIEYILSYVKDIWGCGAVFYTNPKYHSEAYGNMVLRLHELQERWGFGLISMWDDASFNGISEAERELYMYDAVHPTRAGYREWWTPYFEKALFRIMY